MARTKSDEAREFYLRPCIKNKYTARELDRQIDSILFERTMLSDKKNKLFVSKNKSLSCLRDTYIVEFLNLPENHKEKDLRKSIVSNIKDFILEFGKDFTFVLVAIELKTGKFRPEHLGQLNFYLEALDRDIKKENKNPSVV